MSRKPAQGSLEAAALSLAQEVSGNPDDWERRRKALFSMQEAVDEAGKTVTPGGEKAVFTAEVWRYLREPLKNTLNDLRSAIVKEACNLLEKLSTASGNSMAAFMRDMLNVLLHLMANGNSVIVGQVDSCMRHIIAHSRFPRQLKEVDYTVKNSRSKDLRESVGSYVLLMLQTWPAASMDKEAGYLESVIELLLRDASSAARTDARASFGILLQHWPKRADRILQAADPRTAKSLREQHDIGEAGIAAAAASSTTSMVAKSSSSSLASSTTNNHTISNNARGGLLGGGASRVSKAAGSGGSTLMSRRGPSSAEALRAAATENSENPGTSPLQHRHLKAGGATTGTTRGVSRKPRPTMPTAATSSVIDSRSTPSTPTSSLLLSSKKNRRNGLVPHAAGSPATSSPGPAAAAAAALAKTSSPSPGGKSIGTRKRRPATSKAASTLPSTSPVTARAGSSGSAATSSSTTRSSIGKAKRAAAAAAAAGGGTRPLAIGGSNSNSNSNSNTPTGSSSSRAAVPIALARPGTAVSPSLLVSPEGFLAPGSSSKRAGAPRSAAAAAAGAASRARGSQDDGGGGGGDSVSGSVALSEEATASLVEGDKVRLQGGTVRDAVVRYVGETQFATGVWIGVELSPDAVPPGRNDGTVNGVSYFKCPPACGVFAKPDMFELVEEEDEEDEEARGENGRAGSSDEATQAGSELLRHHKLFANEALEALKEEMSMIPGLEGLVESQQAVDADRVRFYLEVLENAAVAREAAAARLRSQIQETAKKYPSVFSPSFGDVSDGEDGRDGSTDGDKKQVAGDGVGGDDVEGVDVESGKGNTEGDGAQVEATVSGEGEEEGSGNAGGEAPELDQLREKGAGDGGGIAADAGDDAGKKQASSNPGDSKKVAKKGGEGQGNVFGIAGKFLRDVLHIPPGGGGGGRDGGDASAVSQQSSDVERDEKKRDGGGGGNVDSPTPVEVAVVDATSPTTPIAIAADSKIVCVGAVPGKSDAGEIDEPAAVAEGEVEGVPVESVMVDIT